MIRFFLSTYRNVGVSAILLGLVLCGLQSSAEATFRLRITPAGNVNLSTNRDPDSSPYTYASQITLAVTNSGGGTVVGRWYLSLYGSGDFASVANPTRTIALGSLEWKRSTASTYTAFATSPALVVSGTANGSYPIDLRLNLSWSDPYATDYRTTLTATLTDTP